MLTGYSFQVSDSQFHEAYNERTQRLLMPAIKITKLCLIVLLTSQETLKTYFSFFHSLSLLETVFKAQSAVQRP